MTDSVRIEPVPAHRDPRGALFEPIDDVALARQRNTHVVLTAPGFVRGNHLHRVGTEITVVVGPAFVRLREAGVTRDVEVPDGEAWRFTIPPGVAHAYRNPGPATMLLIAFNTELNDAENPDVERMQIL